MTHFIKIDLKTIRKNPNSGKMELVPTERRATFTCVDKDLPDFLIEGCNFDIIEETISFGSDGHLIISKGIIRNFPEIKKEFEKLGDIPYGFTLEIDQDYVEIHHPFQKYFYSYQNPMISCNYCDAEFRYNDLQEQLDNDYAFAMNICPACGQCDCVDLEFETIDEALKRKKLKYF